MRAAVSLCNRLGRVVAIVLVAGLLVGLVALPAAAGGQIQLPSDVEECDGLLNADGKCVDSSWFNITSGDYDLRTITAKIMGILTWVFAIISVVLTVLLAKQGFAIAASGSNPQARAQAQSGLWSVVLGSAIFWTATIISAVIRHIFSSGAA